MRKATFSFVLFSVLLVSVVVSASERLKPGLWIVTLKSDAMKNARQMPQMSPEQMETMRKMGVNLQQVQAGIVENKVCMTKEMVERDSPPMGKSQSNCRMENFIRSGSTYSAVMVCDGPNMKGTATIKGMHSGPENYSWTSDFKGTARGHQVDTHQEGSGKWLGSDCGDVKPVTEYLKKK